MKIETYKSIENKKVKDFIDHFCIISAPESTLGNLSRIFISKDEKRLTFGRSIGFKLEGKTLKRFSNYDLKRLLIWFKGEYSLTNPYGIKTKKD